MLYLIVAGSIIGFTAYVWLIHHESPTKVGTYAYVNPLVAVLLGWAVLGERVITLLRNEPERLAMGEAGQELIAREFSAGSMVDLYERLYERLTRS